MSTITEERTTTDQTTTTEPPTTASTTWVCDNCTSETAAMRKRCSECGTSRY